MNGEITALEDGDKALDKSVVVATEQRKQDHEESNDLMSSVTHGKDLLTLVKNRSNKSYKPKIYKPPPRRELSKEDHIMTGLTETEPPVEAPGKIAVTGISVRVAEANKPRRTDGACTK